MTKFTEWEPENHWDEHPDWPSRDWRYQVDNGDTRQGYVAWVNSQIEQAAEEPARFNHTYDFCFDVQSNCDDGSDVTPDMLIEAMRHRINRIETNDRSEILEACGLVDTTQEPTV